jgi:hypothetical protein
MGDPNHTNMNWLNGHITRNETGEIIDEKKIMQIKWTDAYKFDASSKGEE